MPFTISLFRWNCDGFFVSNIHANNTFRADFIYENLAIQNNAIWGAFQSGVQNLMFLGSSCIYPKHAPQPLKEEYMLTGPLELTNEPYAVAKIAGIKLCENLNRQYGMTIVMATNKGGVVAQHCDRLVVLHEGRVVAQGAPREVFGDRELLARVMLRVPQVARLGAYLADRGLPLPRTPVTLDEGREGIEKLLGGVA